MIPGAGRVGEGELQVWGPVPRRRVTGVVTRLVGGMPAALDLKGVEGGVESHEGGGPQAPPRVPGDV